MTLKQRIGQLESKVGHRTGEYAHLTDDELNARIISLATELQASRPPDPETAAFLKSNGLWLGDEPP